MIKTEQLLAELNELIGDYDRFAQIAMEIPWFPVEEHHDNWSRSYPVGIYVDMICFPKGYVEANFSEAFVRAALSAIAFGEEWDKDFWDIPSEERKKCLYSEHSENCYGSYINFKDMRLQAHTEEHLRKEVNWFAGENGVSLGEQEKYLAYAKDAIILELGGYYSGDYTYLVVKEDTILLIDCGIWD